MKTRHFTTSDSQKNSDPRAATSKPGIGVRTILPWKTGTPSKAPVDTPNATRLKLAMKRVTDELEYDDKAKDPFKMINFEEKFNSKKVTDEQYQALVLLWLQESTKYKAEERKGSAASNLFVELLALIRGIDTFHELVEIWYMSEVREEVNKHMESLTPQAKDQYMCHFWSLLRYHMEDKTKEKDGALAEELAKFLVWYRATKLDSMMTIVNAELVFEQPKW
ncbi:hypothetical protein BS50DRAFT_636796 [Corynespora cassiicola Philippines]|uniref:Uncharacterized protein n=1 Tax=Corynespora cassiicola Philippines TaxID=1448308 RepID=A0A2T2NGU0_CORCC|nr:hypothetical protein BS50DRAFT_636796 [Corynespora cassiicola Philippines]